MHATRLVEPDRIAAYVDGSIGSSWPDLGEVISIFLTLAQERLIPVLSDEAFTPHPTDMAVMAAFVEAGYAREDRQHVIWTDKNASHLVIASEATRGGALARAAGEISVGSRFVDRAVSKILERVRMDGGTDL